MADSTLDSCSSKNLANSSGNCLPERRSKKKFCGYHYVPSESDEADTLKDKFWRDLEQGKLNFLNTVDMYTRVKQLGKLTEVDYLAASYQDSVLSPYTAPATCLQSNVSLSSVIGSLASARDASPPSSSASSGYESSSIPSIGSLSVTDSPTEPDPSVSNIGDSFTNVAQSNSLLELRRKRKRINRCIWESSFRSKRRRRHPTAMRSASSHQKKTTNSKFFRYVDATSEEADTLKDKFWRDLEEGNVSAITTDDLYSSVKVSRRARQLSLSNVRNFDHEKDSNEVADTHVRGSQASHSSDCTSVLDIDVKCSEVDSSNRKNGPDNPIDCYLSEQIVSVADCKLLSPCSVSVERLPFSTESSLTRKDRSCVLRDISVNMDSKQYWHTAGKCRTGSSQLSNVAHTSICISGSKSRAEHVHFSSFEINGSLTVCHVPLSSTQQRRFLCDWFEDDAAAEAGSLRDAVMSGNIWSVRKFLAAEANYLTTEPVQSDKFVQNNMTLVMLAARHGMDTVIELLVKSGYDVNIQRPDGITALMIACRMGFVNAARVLLDSGAKTELSTCSGETALVKAVRSGSSDIVAMLLSRGANFAIKSHSGLTAATLACRAQRHDIFTVINSHIRRLSCAFAEQISSVISCFANVEFPVFPLQCFPLNNSCRFCVTFSTKRLFTQEEHHAALLFIGHALIGCQAATCRLDGISAVTDAFLNNDKLQCLSANGNFIMSFEHLRDGQNELILHLDTDPSSKVALIVCAYYVSCKSRFRSRDY